MFLIFVFKSFCVNIFNDFRSIGNNIIGLFFNFSFDTAVSTIFPVINNPVLSMGAVKSRLRSVLFHLIYSVLPSDVALAPKKTVSNDKVLFKNSFEYTLGAENLAVSEASIRLSDGDSLKYSTPFLKIRSVLFFVEGSLNSKLPTIWRVEKQMKSR